MMNSKLLAVIAVLGLTSNCVYAAPLVGTGQGSFSNLASCNINQDCRIVNSANGPQVQWGSQNQTTKFVNPSTLTAVDSVINTTTNAYDVILGQLDWYNSATWRLTDSLDVFSVKWNLAVNFTTPSLHDTSGGEVFNLTIKNPINPPGDSIYGFELADLANLGNSFNLDGITVSNLRYAVVDGAGSGTSFLSASSIHGKTHWYNDEDNYASLYILADFTAAPDQHTTPIPEPEIYAMLGLGLGLMGFVARRRQRNQAVA